MKSELLLPHKEIALYPRCCDEKIIFENDKCKFTPCGWIKIENDVFPKKYCEFFPLGYKVVTEDMKSLGLRKNPNIMTFPINEWVVLPDEEIKAGEDDWGGIWTALRKGSIKTLQNYCLEKYQMKTRAFLTAMYQPVFANSYRIKSQGVMLLEEIF